MKKIRGRLSIIFILAAMSLCTTTLHAQNLKQSKPDMQTLLASKHYLFTALYAQPLSGRQVNLTSTYTLRMAGDSLVCQLPYYGRAYTVDSYPGGGGLDFTSLHYDYDVAQARHSRYTVAIKINDKTMVTQMYLNVSKNGYATLQVTPTNKQAISYYGNITELPARR